MSVLRQENGVKLAPSIAVDTTTTTGNTADTAMSSSAAPSPAGTSPTQYVTVTIVALTTTFTGPASCAEARLTQLSSPVYEIWVNEPQPVPGTRFGDCFPSQFIEGYSSVGNASSSVAPFFSPLVCPSAWHTARIWENGYIACCISGFQLGVPPSPVDRNRPAYGGTCYSAFQQGQTVQVTQFDTASLTATATWYASTNTDHAYAHPIDGFRLDSRDSAATGLSRGAIAGTVVGAVVGLFGLLGLLYLWWRRRRRRQAVGRKRARSRDASAGRSYDGFTVAGTESDHSKAMELAKDSSSGPCVVTPETAGTPLCEMGNLQIGEMDGGWRGNEIQASSKPER